MDFSHIRTLLDPLIPTVQKKLFGAIILLGVCSCIFLSSCTRTHVEYTTPETDLSSDIHAGSQTETPPDSSAVERPSVPPVRQNDPSFSEEMALPSDGSPSGTGIPETPASDADGSGIPETPASDSSGSDMPVPHASDTRVSVDAQTPIMGETEAVQTISYSADSVDYDVNEKVIRLNGNSLIQYGTLELDAETIELDTETKLMIAESTPVLKDGENILIGRRMVYNMDTEVGIVYDGITDVEEGICTGSEMRKVDDETLNVYDGTYSTCRLKDPHYDISSRMMRILKDDKAVAKPVVMRIEEIPVFYLPFYIFSIKKGRHSGLLIPNYNEDLVQGKYLSRLGYYWATNDYMDLTFASDLYENGNLKLDIDYRYALMYVIPSGALNLNAQLYPSDGDRRYSSQFRHSHMISRDLKIYANSAYNAHEKRDGQDSKTLNNTLTLTRRWKDTGTLNVNLRSNRNLITRDKVEYLPTLTFSTYSRAFLTNEDSEAGDVVTHWYNKFYHSTRTVFIRSRVVSDDRMTAHNAAETSCTLSSRQMLFGWLNFPTSVQVKGAVFNNRPRYDDEGNETGTDWGYFPRIFAYGDTRMNMTIRGLYNPDLPGVQGVLHTVKPSVGFQYTPYYGRYFYKYSYEQDGTIYSGEKRRFYSIGSIGSVPGEKRFLNYSLVNSLDLKWKGDEKEEKFHLTSLSLSGTYDFLNEESPLSPYQLSFNLNPFRNASFNMTTRWDPYGKEWGPINTSSRITLSGTGNEGEEESYIRELMKEEGDGEKPEEEALIGPDYFYETGEQPVQKRPWRISLSLLWTKFPSTGTVNSSVTGSAQFNLTRNWRFNVNAGYNITDEEFTHQSLYVVRDLHCWEILFNWHRYGDIWNYKLLIRIKKIPEIKIEHREQFYSRNY
jgi:hypothetical protein